LFVCFFVFFKKRKNGLLKLKLMLIFLIQNIFLLVLSCRKKKKKRTFLFKFMGVKMPSSIDQIICLLQFVNFKTMNQ